MRDRGLIWTGLAFFLAFLSFPVWHNLAARVTAKGPGQVAPKGAQQCVAPVEYMKTSHMTLLLAWRDSAIRSGVRDYTAADGRHYTISLSNTCLRQCHGARADFCDRCHNYAAVAPPCWDCHVDARVTQALVPAGSGLIGALAGRDGSRPGRLESLRHGTEGVR